jgi:formylglycine-generating enzyme required for sulfatase activity
MKSIMNPYVGLRPFEAHESHLFFGRRKQSAELLNQLEKTHLLSVVGSSGCGKSSLIRAGLIPLLRAGFLVNDRDKWHEIVMKPGNRPLNQLAKSVCYFLGNASNPDEFYEHLLIDGASAIVESINPFLTRNQSCMLLLVDQFEEIFRFAQEKGTMEQEDESAFFVSVLLELAEQKNVPIYIVLTLRSDFIGHCDQFHGLPEAICQSLYLVPRMTREQQREAITGPAAIAGVKMSDTFIRRILNDMTDSHDQLPVIQHALMRTWNEWLKDDSNQSVIHHYKSGTLSEFISKHADDIYSELKNKDLVIRIFKSLTHKISDVRGIRRPTKLKDLYKITGAKSTSDIDNIINVYRQPDCSFLMPPQKIILSPDVVVDISHESLMRLWDRLKKWVDEEALSAKEYRRLADTALRFQSKQSDYIRGPELISLQKWYEKQHPNKAWADQYHTEQECETNLFERSIQFLKESSARQEKEIEKQQKLALEKQEREKKEAIAAEEKKKNEALDRVKKYRKVTISVISGLLLAIFMSVFSGYHYIKSNQARDAALKSSMIANQARIKATVAQKQAEQRLKKILALQDTLNPLAEQQGRLYFLDLPQETHIDIINSDKQYDPGMKLDAGEYRIKFTHKNYDEKQMNINVEAGKENKVRIEMAALPSELLIYGQPDDAHIFVNDERKGHGNVQMKNLKPDLYQIRVQKDLFEPFETEIALGPNEKKNITYRLVGLSKITVVCRPSDARVRILNIRPVYTDGMILKPGRYDLEITHNDYFPLRQWITIDKGEWLVTVSLIENQQTICKSFQNQFNMTFVYIAPGKFMMGSPENEKGRDENKEKLHPFVIKKGFYMQTTEVTQGQYTAVMGYNPSNFNLCGNDCPVETVSWNDTQAFIEKLNSIDKHRTYRLPGEAEWEYSARSGNKTAFSNGDIKIKLGCDDSNLDPNLNKMGWYCGNSLYKTHLVAQKKSNAWYLYDMHGNVSEWCKDQYSDSKDDKNGQLKNYIIRGGSFNSYAFQCRSANRNWREADESKFSIGFRIVAETDDIPGQTVASQKMPQGDLRIEPSPPPLTGENK